MSERLRIQPLPNAAARSLPGTDEWQVPGIHIQPIPDRVRWSMRTNPAHTRSFVQLLGFELPCRPLSCAGSATAEAWWLGPDEWLLLMNRLEASRFRERLRAFDWSAAPAVSLVEITQRQLGLEIRGPSASWLLNAGCPLDLSSSAFAPGMCARTLFGKAEIILQRRADASDTFHVECWRSFVPYLRRRLEQAAAQPRPASGAAWP
jgi:sarcosine oxidase subunit gamma